MSTEEEVEFAFDCPECGESLATNDAMRETLVEKGCVVCGATVTNEAFTRTSIPESE